MLIYQRTIFMTLNNPHQIYCAIFCLLLLLLLYKNSKKFFLMETTKDGFTFKRRGSNKKIEFECRKIKATDIFLVSGGEKTSTACNGRGTGVEDSENEFNFNVVRKKGNGRSQTVNSRDTNKKLQAANSKDTDKNRPRRAKNVGEKESNAASKRLRRSTSNSLKEASKTLPKRQLEARKQPISKNDENSLVFSIVKKRKTIRMENDIDLSTDDESVRQITEREAEGSTADMKLPVINNGSSIFVDGRNEEVLRMEIPTIPEKLKSNEIHKKVAGNSINDLIRECLSYLKDNSNYSKEIVKHCNSNYFSDVDYRKEIEQIKNRNNQIKSEIEKWSNVKDLEMCENGIQVPTISEENEEGDIDSCDNGMELARNKQAMIDEFNGKSQRLLGLEGKLRYFFENAKDKTENLLKNIFGSLEERSVDAIFLLKAMSKLGR